MGQSDHTSQETPMSRFWRHFISNGADSGQGPNYFAPEPTEREALDAYSNVVVDVAERLRPAVVNLRAAAVGGKAPAPASCSRPTASC